MAEAWAKRVTGDEPQGTMGRLQTVGEARCLLPAFFCAHIFIKERRLGTRQEQSEVYGEAGPLVGSIPSAMVTSSVLLFASSLLFERFLQAQKYKLKATTIL